MHQGKWLKSHTKKIIKQFGNDFSKLYDNFFFLEDQKDLQGDLGEVYVDYIQKNIFHRVDLQGHYNYRPATKDEDFTEHHDSSTSKGLVQTKNTYKLPYTTREDGTTTIHNTALFINQGMKPGNEDKVLVLVTTARREDIDPRILAFEGERFKIFSREDMEPWVTKSALVDFIKYIEDGETYFKEQKQKMIDDYEEKIPYDYQQKEFDEIDAEIEAGRQLDRFIRVGQGGGKTDIIKHQVKTQLLNDIHSVVVFPRLRLIDDMCAKIVPAILGTKGLANTPIYAGSSRREWDIEKRGFKIVSFSVSALLNDKERRDLLYKSGQATLTLLCYDQLANFNKLLKIFKEEEVQ